MISKVPLSPGEDARRIDRIRPFHVMDLLARARHLESQGRDVVHLEVGEPDFPTPQPVIDAGIRALESKLTHYTPALGLPELRAAIAGYYQERFGARVAPERVVVTTGASGALQLALSVLLNYGDEVLLADPGYPCNRNMVTLMGGDVRMVAVDSATRYQLTDRHIEEKWGRRTVAAMIASPSNPTGTTIRPTELDSLQQAVRRRGGTLIVDEIYQGIAYDGNDHTALSLSDDLFVINSFSKYFGMTGWRLGWMVVPEDSIDAADRVAQNLFLAAPTVAQHAALAAFEQPTLDILQQRVAVFRERRDFLLPALSELGFGVLAEPDGAFYIYANCGSITRDSFRWTRDLLEAEGVAVTPGADFGDYRAAGHVRFAYTRPVERLREACERIDHHIRQHDA